MKICIPTQSNEGMNAKVSGHFGKSPYFTIYDTVKKSIRTIKNAAKQDGSGEGKGTGRFLIDQDIQCVISFGMGKKLYERLEYGGIKVFQIKASRVCGVIEKFEEGSYKILTKESRLVHDNSHC